MIFLANAVLALAPAAPPVDFDASHAAWTEVLQAHLSEGRFDYAALKKDRRKLDAYLAQLEAVRLDQLRSWKRADRYAFWINAYNAYTVSLVVENYPIDSIKDLGGLFKSVWKQRFIPLGHLYPEAGEEGYTWWSNRGQAWANNVGWRIDYQLATPGIAAKALSAKVYKEQRFSDHAPLCVDYAI